MKRFIFTMAIGFAVCGAAGCEPKANEASKSPPGGSEYPLKTCVVSGKELGSMGEPFVHKHEGKEVRFCCKGCLKDFNADPAKYLAKLDEAAVKK